MSTNLFYIGTVLYAYCGVSPWMTWEEKGAYWMGLRGCVYVTDDYGTLVRVD